MRQDSQQVNEINRKMTCITCPTGCQLEVSRGSDGQLKIAGFQCQRGEEYARNEVLDPRRVLTTTVKIKGGILPLLPVRTATAIPKELLADAMNLLAAIKAQAPIQTGDIVLANLLDTGIDVIASRDMERE
jgi:CxxC motif-containing protein